MLHVLMISILSLIVHFHDDMFLTTLVTLNPLDVFP